ncbi:E1A 6 kDa protein [Human mastadenovirus B]|uniref:Early E1A protein n=1 Tax=Human mastadenovirus B TaxID=108098 RepID=J7I733_9ADEN|nr:E1A 6 kDa protein [Human mastadenovirus B]WEG78347.1 E1A 6 kDa protein [Human adenovirus B3]AFQ34332.1 E1A 6 kDa protein [Human mastadenovirus B]AFQ34371.1 E1A 6 kDa protein [Human mastadenovirus B]AFQ34528.1 E1A 6 kDa protein [Human mastadenovirus B]
MRHLRFLPQEIISSETGIEILEFVVNTLMVLCLMMSHLLLIQLLHFLKFRRPHLQTYASPFL